MPPAYEVLLLNTAVPQIQAAQSGDTYVVPRDIAFSAALTLSAGTANGVPYLNGSKVLTSGSALTFDGSALRIKVATDQNLAIDSGSGVIGLFALNDAVTSPVPLQFQGEYLRFNAGAPSASEAMRLTSTGLGIGTSSPTTQLQIAGSTFAIMRLSAGAGDNNARVDFGTVASPDVGRIGYNNSTNGFTFRTNGSDVMTLDSSGTLGLGVTPKTDWNAAYVAFQFGAGSSLSGHTSTSLNFTILASNQYINTAGTSKFINDGYAPRYLQRGDTGEHYWYTTNSGLANGDVVNTQAMTLGASGNLLVGNTADPIGSNRMLVQSAGTANNNRTFTVYNTAATSTTAFANRIVQLSSLGSGADVTVQFTDQTAYNAYIGMGSGALYFATNGTTERARITSGGNFKIGGSADRATTEGDKQLVLFDGTAPVGTLANGVSFYSASGEANVMDAAGNATLLSPHDAVTNEWIFRSKHTPTGKVLKIDVERLLKFVNDHFGLDAVHEFIED